MNIQIVLAGILTVPLGMTAPAMAQDSSPQAQAFSQDPQRIHSRLSVDDELARLTKDLDLTPAQRHQILPILRQHHDKIQALFDQNPDLS
jgi:Spy/CpxP family protein refolding chaperone